MNIFLKTRQDSWTVKDKEGDRTMTIALPYRPHKDELRGILSGNKDNIPSLDGTGWTNKLVPPFINSINMRASFCTFARCVHMTKVLCSELKKSHQTVRTSLNLLTTLNEARRFCSEWFETWGEWMPSSILTYYSIKPALLNHTVTAVKVAHEDSSISL